jgi:pimeloyl-ACP methyl ester carboxylesterase
MTAARATAQVPRPSVLPAGRLLDNDCPSTVVLWWQRLANGGRIVCAHDPTRPAILLVHGLHQNITTWTAPSTVGYSYDLARDPGSERIGDTHQDPGVGIYKVGTSPWLYGDDPAAWDRDHNWFDYLAGLGFTVAAWSQPGTSFQDAVPSALQAFDSLMAQTRARSPRSAPPIALIGHSRGGLVIRRILKDRKSSGDIGRVKWVVTLHSPHRGSALGEYPGRLVAETVDLIECCAPPSLTAPLKTQLKNAVTEAMRPMTKMLVDFESRELTAESPMLRDLESGETAIPGVKYYTFGGVNPTFYRLYAWAFDANSAVPQYKNLSQYFVWHVNQLALSPVSPVLDKIRPFVREVQAGYGDGLVTDASARLPWSTHVTDHLNHAQVLWDRPLQMQVVQLIERK